MKLKHKISLLVIGILLVISLFISSSYALWVFNVSQESTNVVQSDCFEITFTDGSSAIKLEHSFPMKDSKGVYTTPYEFTLTNICEHAADISINLEILNDSEVDGENLRVDVNGHIHTYGDENIVEPTLDNATSAASFYNDTIAARDSKNYNLRLWIKEDVSNDNVLNKTLSSKITIKSTLRKNYNEATLINGNDFYIALRTLAGHFNPNSSYHDESVISIQKSLTAPTEEDNAINVSEPNSSMPIYAWFKDGVIYIYSEADRIYMNENSQRLFEGYSKLTSLDLSFLDTSKVTNMSRMFIGLSSLTSIDVSHFDTSNVEDMSSLFDGCSSLTSIDVSSFNTSKVTDMNDMFNGMKNVTNIDVSHFDTSKVTDMSKMFSNMYKLESLDVSHFDTSKVTNMSFMFHYMSIVNSLDVSNFDTSKVTDMSSMFALMSNLETLDVSNFDTSNVEEMDNMFSLSMSLKYLNLENFNTSNVTNMSGMFAGSGYSEFMELEAIDGLSSFDTSKVTNMSKMFYNCNKLKELNLSSFDTLKVTNMSYMFNGDDGLTNLDLSSFVTSNVTNMARMFYGMDHVESINVSNFDTSKVTDMSYMFYYNINLLELDISSFDTLKVTNMSYMFGACKKLKTIYVSNKWDVSNVTASSLMLNGVDSIVGGAGTTYDSSHINKAYAHVDGGPSNPGYFTLKTN